MDMKLDQQILKSERAKRAWSQEHLAHVAGLGVRTIQRTESTGLTSYDSAQAIASAFEMPVGKLLVAETRFVVSAMRIRLGIVAAFLTGLLLLVATRTVLAEQVLLELNAMVDQKQVSEAQRTLSEGQSAEFQIGKEFRLNVASTILDSGEVQLSMRLSKYDGEKYIQVAHPQIVTPNQQVARLESESSGGTVVVEITPTIQ